MSIGKRRGGETMEDVYRIKRELSLRNSSLPPDEMWREVQKGADRFIARTGVSFVHAEPPAERKHQAG